MRLAGVVGILFAVCSSTATADGMFPMPCDQPRNDDLVTPTDRDTLTFPVSAGERFFITILEVSGTPGFEPHWRVLDASGTEVVGANGHRGDTGPLAAGAHRIEVFDWGLDATGSYRLHLQRLTAAHACDDVALGCDVPADAAIASPVDNDLFSFAVTATERLFVSVPEVSGEGFDAHWRVLDASGAEVRGWTSAYRDDIGPLAPAGSPYRIQVLDGSGVRTGAYRVRVQRVTAASACDALPLACDTPRAAAIADPTDSDVYTFACSEGERVWIGALTESGAGFTAGWRLLDASGTPVTGWTYGVWQDHGPLPAAGSPYAIQVIDWSGTATGTYVVHLQRLTLASACDAVPLACDVAVTATIASPVDTDLWSFPAVAGEMLDVTVGEVSGAGFNAQWRLLDASGIPVGGWAAHIRDDRGPIPATGTYALQVADYTATATGTYRVRVQRLTAPVACEDVPLSCDVPVTGTIDSPLDSDLLSFDVSDGERLYVSLIETEGTPEFNVGWRVLDASGAAVTGRIADARADVGPLAASGNPYRLDVWDWSEDGTGTYQAGLHRLPAATACDVVPFGCDTTLAGAIDSRIDVDGFAFPAAEGEHVYVGLRADAAGPDFDPIWRIVDASGVDVSGWVGAGRYGFGPLHLAGSPYSFQVRDSGENGTGTYHANLQRVTPGYACDAVPLGCDTTFVAALETRMDTDLYRFDVAEGERLWIAVSEVSGSPAFDPHWRVLRADGTEFAGWTGGVWDDRGPFTAADSPCLVQVLDSNEDATGTYRIHLQRLTATAACEGMPLPRETSRTDSITTPIDSDLFTLVLPPEYPAGAGAGYTFPISVTALTAAPGALDPQWRLIDGSGQTAGGCGWAGWDRTCEVSAQDGPFRVQVLSGSASRTGIYEVSSGFYGATGVVTMPAPIPTEFAFATLGPNPFGRSTTLELAVPRPGPVRVRVFDVRGREVARIVDGEIPAGLHRVPWDAAGLAGGVYFCRMEAAGFAQSRKLLLVR